MDPQASGRAVTLSRCGVLAIGRVPENRNFSFAGSSQALSRRHPHSCEAQDRRTGIRGKCSGSRLVFVRTARTEGARLVDSKLAPCGTEAALRTEHGLSALAAPWRRVRKLRLDLVQRLRKAIPPSRLSACTGGGHEWRSKRIHRRPRAQHQPASDASPVPPQQIGRIVLIRDAHVHLYRSEQPSSPSCRSGGSAVRADCGRRFCNRLGRRS